LVKETLNERTEANFIVSQIVKHMRQGHKLSDFTILYRTHAQSRTVEEALITHHLPYQIVGGLKFYDRREIKDIVAALRYAANPKDEVSRDRLEKNFSKGRFREFQESLARESAQTPLALIKLFLSVTDYFDYMDRNYTNALERKENVAELMHFASEFTELPPLLERLSLLQATDAVGTMNNDNNHDKDSKSHRHNHSHRDNWTGTPVQLMTMHLAKGLEFDRVFVAGACEGLLPHARSLDTEKELEEERRLLYVAMTRARHELIISFYDLPSRFLSEIPQELLEFESAISDAPVFSDDEERCITLD